MKFLVAIFFFLWMGACMAQQDVGAQFPQPDMSVYFLDGEYLLFLPQPSAGIDTLGRISLLDPQGESLQVQPDSTSGLGLIFLSFLNHLQTRKAAAQPCKIEDAFALLQQYSGVDAVCVRFAGDQAHLAFVYQTEEIEPSDQPHSLSDVKLFIGDLQEFLKTERVPAQEFSDLFEEYKDVGVDSAQKHFRYHVEEKGQFWENCYLIWNVKNKYPDLFQKFRQGMERIASNLYHIKNSTTTVTVEKLDLVKDDPSFIGKYLERLSSKSCKASDLFIVESAQTHLKHKFIFPEKSYLEYWWPTWKRFDPVGSFVKEDVEWCLQEVLDTIANRIQPYQGPILDNNITLPPINGKIPLAIKFKEDDHFHVWSPMEDGTARQLRLRNLELYAKDTLFIKAIQRHLQPSDGKTDLFSLGKERFALTASGHLSHFFEGSMDKIGQVKRPVAQSLWEWFLRDVIEDRSLLGRNRMLQSFELVRLAGFPEFIAYAYPQDTTLTLLVEINPKQRKKIHLHDPEKLRENAPFFELVLSNARGDGSILQLFRANNCTAAFQQPQLWLDNPAIPVLNSIYCPRSRHVFLAIVDTFCLQIPRGFAPQSTFYAPQPSGSSVMGIKLLGHPYRLFTDAAEKNEVMSARFQNPEVAQAHPEFLSLLIQNQRGSNAPIQLWHIGEVFFAFQGDQLWTWQEGLSRLMDQQQLSGIQDSEVMEAFLTKMAQVLERDHIDAVLNARFSYDKDSMGMAVMGGNFKGEGDSFWVCGRPNEALKVADNLFLNEFLDDPIWLITYLKDVFLFGKEQLEHRKFQGSSSQKQFWVIHVKSPGDSLRIFDFKTPRTFEGHFNSKHYADLGKMPVHLAIEFLGYLYGYPATDIWATSESGFCTKSSDTVRIRMLSKRSNEALECTMSEAEALKNVNSFKENRGEGETVTQLCRRLTQCILNHWDGNDHLLHEQECGFKYIPGKQRTILDLFCN